MPDDEVDLKSDRFGESKSRSGATLLVWETCFELEE